ncbi:hypothetical protein ACO0LV_07370 [Pseudactinotalea sp. Z1739]|uniref:hypothetical protein n=1 Tax=Pseudactinotalea sp. Z1739 TaxID=3413028 RepID=UPI003C7ABD48
MKKSTAAAFALTSALLLAGCGSGDDHGAASDDTQSGAGDSVHVSAEEADADGTGEGGGDTVATAEDDADGTEEGNGASSTTAAEGVVSVDGYEVTFTPETCLTGDHIIVSGPGTDDTGAPAFVDSGDNNQLNVYIGTDDPFGEAEREYEHADVLGDLAGLHVEGSRITASPEMVRTDDGSYAAVGNAELQVTCD